MSRRGLFAGDASLSLPVRATPKFSMENEGGKKPTPTDKLGFFLEAMRAGCYRRRAWWFSAFALISEDAEKWKEDPYPYRIVQNLMGVFYVDPNNPSELVKITDAKVGEAPFYHKDKIKLQPGSVPNLTSEVETTYGNLIWNYTILVYPFGSKIEFRVGRQTASAIEDIIKPILTDNPKAGEQRDDKLIYVDEYLKFTDSVFFTTGFTQLFVPAATKKSITPPPGIAEFKAKLLEEYKDRLHDPAIAALIGDELVKFDAEYLKGDPSEGFLIYKKSRNTVRRKMFLMYGAEPGLDDKYDIDLIPASLSEGWDIAKFPQLNNSLRAGSYGRGAETAVGGEAVKWLLRASSNITVTVDDCGSKLGVPTSITEQNAEKYYGMSVVTQAGPELLNKDTVRKYIGKDVLIRSPMFCNLTKTDYCRCCVGERLALNPTAVSSAIAEYGSTFLDIYMSAAHAKTLSIQKLDWKKHFK